MFIDKLLLFSHADHFQIALCRTRELFPGSEMDRYAAFAADSLRKTRARENVPSQEEIRCIVARQDMSTTVHCHGGGSCKITINSHTTAGEVGLWKTGLCAKAYKYFLLVYFLLSSSF